MRVVIADDHLTVRLGLKGLLLTTEIQVVGESEDGEEAIRLAEELRPDLVILGLNLTGETDGVEVCRRIQALSEPPRILVHFAHEFSDYVSENLLVGADGYVRKRTCCRELLDAIRRTAAGERTWPPDGAAGEPGSRTHPAPEGIELTHKEREVLALMLRRYSNDEMARRLHLSLPTVKTHVRNILRKLGAKNRKELFRSHAPKAFAL